MLGRGFKSSGDAIVLLGETRHELGGSEYLKVMHGADRGSAAGRRSEGGEGASAVAGDGGTREGLLRSAHDCAEGGLAVTLAECAFGTGGVGLTRRSAGCRCVPRRGHRSRRCFRSRRRASSSPWRASISARCWTGPRRSACRRGKSARPEPAGSASQSMGRLPSTSP